MADLRNRPIETEGARQRNGDFSLRVDGSSRGMRSRRVTVILSVLAKDLAQTFGARSFASTLRMTARAQPPLDSRQNGTVSRHRRPPERPRRLADLRLEDRVHVRLRAEPGALGDHLQLQLRLG